MVQEAVRNDELRWVYLPGQRLERLLALTGHSATAVDRLPFAPRAAPTCTASPHRRAPTHHLPHTAFTPAHACLPHTACTTHTLPHTRTPRVHAAAHHARSRTPRTAHARTLLHRRLRCTPTRTCAPLRTTPHAHLLPFATRACTHLLPPTTRCHTCTTSWFPHPPHAPHTTHCNPLPPPPCPPPHLPIILTVNRRVEWSAQTLRPLPPHTHTALACPPCSLYFAPACRLPRHWHAARGTAPPPPPTAASNPSPTRLLHRACAAHFRRLLPFAPAHACAAPAATRTALPRALLPRAPLRLCLPVPHTTRRHQILCHTTVAPACLRATTFVRGPTTPPHLLSPAFAYCVTAFT